jgi:hypothetical protein
MNITTPSVAAKRSFSKEVARIKTSQQLLTILILLFICMIFWIIVSLFSSQTNTKITPEVLEMAKPFNPTLSTEVLDSIEQRTVITDEELVDFPIKVIQKDLVTQEETIVDLQTRTSGTTTPASPQSDTVTPPAQTQNVVDTQ